MGVPSSLAMDAAPVAPLTSACLLCVRQLMLWLEVPCVCILAEGSFNSTGHHSLEWICHVTVRGSDARAPQPATPVPQQAMTGPVRPCNQGPVGLLQAITAAGVVVQPGWNKLPTHY
jgi:hypothetical protein